jgi:hypothetical protein
MNKDTFKVNISFLRQVSSALLPDDSACKIVRDIWWTNQDFSPVDNIPPWFSMIMYHLGMNNRPVGGCSSET